ncbi:MAG: WD40 repeat domain-containing protein [Mycobacterium sp.]
MPVTVAVSPTGQLVALSYQDGPLTVVDAAGAPVPQTSGSWQSGSLAFSPDGRWLAVAVERNVTTATAQYQVQILDTSSWTQRSSHTGWGNLAFNGDGSWLVATFNDMNTATNAAYAFNTADGTDRWRQLLPIIAGSVLTPDSASLIVTLSDGGAPVVLDAGAGTQRFTLATPAKVATIACSPDSRWILAGCQDGQLRVFDAATGTLAWSVAVVPAGHVGSLAVSADARWCAAVSGVYGTSETILGVYDLTQRGAPRFSSPVMLTQGAQVRYSPTLDRLVVNATVGPAPASPGGGVGYGLSVINARTGAPISSTALPGSDFPFSSGTFAMTPDGGAVVVGTNATVAMYDTGVVASSCDVGVPLSTVVTSPAGRPLVAVADTGGAMTVIDATSGNRFLNKPATGTLASVAFADTGSSVVTGGSTGVRLYSVLGDRTWTVTVSGVNALAAAGPAGEWIAYAAGRSLQMLNSAAGAKRWTTDVAHPQTVTRLAASSDGQWVATGCAGVTRVFNTTTAAQQYSDDGDSTLVRVEALAFQPTGSLVATANDNGDVVVIDAAAGAERLRMPPQAFPCTQVAFNSDGTLLAVACEDDQHTVTVYDISGGDIPQRVQEIACPGPVSDLAFNPVENTLAICAPNSTVVRDARDGTELTRILTPASQLAFSADGAWIATIGTDTVVRVVASGAAPSGA